MYRKCGECEVDDEKFPFKNSIFIPKILFVLLLIKWRVHKQGYFGEVLLSWEKNFTGDGNYKKKISEVYHDVFDYWNNIFHQIPVQSAVENIVW